MNKWIMFKRGGIALPWWKIEGTPGCMGFQYYRIRPGLFGVDCAIPGQIRLGCYWTLLVQKVCVYGINEGANTNK